MMYTWSKSDTETATLRECFPTSVLLGSILDPLLVSDSCVQRDITDDGSGTILACLCDRNHCNDDSKDGGDFSPSTSSNRDPKPPERRVAPQIETTRAPVRVTTRPTQRVSTRPPVRVTTRPPPVVTTRAPQRTNTRPPQSLPSESTRSFCPDEFELASGQCYYISSDRVGWVEARKMCEARGARLVSVRSQLRRAELEFLVGRMVRRRRSEFWLAGNDIDDEGRWEWAKSGGEPVPDWGWSEEYDSPEENCLAWSVHSASSSNSDSFWHGSSCCNNLRYICHL